MILHLLLRNRIVVQWDALDRRCYSNRDGDKTLFTARDSVTTTYTRGTPAGTCNRNKYGAKNTSGIAQAVPNTDNMDSTAGLP